MENFRQAQGKVTLFYITMNMHARSGNPTHMVVGAIDGVCTVEDFHKWIEGRDFVLVQEYYRSSEGTVRSGAVKSDDGVDYHCVGPILLNVMYIGKVKL